ncbi:MAG: tetratricopeptide repeat protein [Planctomycetaceae bacterium]
MTTPRIALLVACALSCAGCGGLAHNDNSQGVRLYQQGNYLGAVDRFQQALAREPGNPDCFYNLGATYHQQSKVFGRPADAATAEQYYHLCLARNPNHAECQRALAVLLVEQKREPEAVAGLETWARSQPGNPAPHVELARLAQEHGDLREAENQLIDALAVAPGDPRTLVALGSIREQAGDAGQAAANYSRALASDPAQPAVAARLASLQSATAGQRTAALPPAVAPPASVPATAAAPPGAAPTGEWGPAR